MDRITDYVNTNALAYMAIGGDPFLTSAWNGFLMNVKHVLKFSFA